MRPARVLYLGPDSRVSGWLHTLGNKVTVVTTPISYDAATRHDFIVSYGYKHLLGPDIIDAFAGRNCNLHVSLLPWNRGADPNFWSWFDGTPKGVSIHSMDIGVDTGPVLCQRAVDFDNNETLRTSYAKLQYDIEGLFKEHWRDIGRSIHEITPQENLPGFPGSYHSRSDIEAMNRLLVDGWDTPCSLVESRVAETQMSQECWRNP